MRVAGFVALATAFVVSACGSCGKSGAGGHASAKASSGGGAGGTAPSRAYAADSPLWENAKSGDDEDLATLAVHEGALGLVDAADDTALRPTAIRAMAFAAGWAQLPYLAKMAAGSDDSSSLAADSVLALATRSRRAEDVEDEDELREGCESLVTTANDKSKARPRRIAIIRALRMLPCPNADVSTDLDTH